MTSQNFVILALLRCLPEQASGLLCAGGHQEPLSVFTGSIDFSCAEIIKGAARSHE